MGAPDKTSSQITIELMFITLYYKYFNHYCYSQIFRKSLKANFFRRRSRHES